MGEAPQPTPTLGEKTGILVFGLLTDIYRQELAAEEDVFRTLPFFATALGLIVALLNYAAAQLPTWHDLSLVAVERDKAGLNERALPPVELVKAIVIFEWPVALAALCLLSVVGLSVLTLWFLGLATLKRSYLRIGPESRIVAATRALHLYHQADHPTSDAGLDLAVVSDVRSQMLDPLTEAITINRDITLQRSHFRSRALVCLLTSLFFALAGTILLLITAKSGILTP